MNILIISLDVAATPQGELEAIWASASDTQDSAEYFDWWNDEYELKADFQALSNAVMGLGWVLELGHETWTDGRFRLSSPKWLRSWGWACWIGPKDLLSAFVGRRDPLPGTVIEPDEAAAPMTAYLHDQGWRKIIASTPTSFDGAIGVWHPTCTHDLEPVEVLARRHLGPRIWEYSQGALAEVRLRDLARRVRRIPTS